MRQKCPNTVGKLKALCLTTGTRNCETLWRSFECLGHECHPHRYDDRPHDRHNELVDLALSLRPDVIIYIGAIEQSAHCKPVPTVETLLRLRDCAPSIHLCGDASDRPWWSWLTTYNERECFSVQVNMDGNSDTPISQFTNGLVLLSPMDVRPFHPKPWNDRGTKLGLVGGQGHTQRQQLILGLQQRGVLTFSDSSAERSYASMAELMCDTKITLNSPFNGTGDRMHVKGRVIEAGLAGCCLLEGYDSPTSRWFNPGQEYFEYQSLEHAIQIVNDTSDDHLCVVAQRFHSRVMTEHHPKTFWNKVLAKAGVSCP